MTYNTKVKGWLCRIPTFLKPFVQPTVKDLVLIGGGHSHAIALRMFGMQPLPGIRITLITEASETAYSGMLPGHVAGLYSQEDCHINLCTLADFANAQIYIDRAIELNLESKQVLCTNHPPVTYNLLSIDIGSTPKLPNGSGIAENVIPAKPVRDFLTRWNQIVSQMTQFPEKPICLCIVGGGAGGVELALNIQRCLQQILQAAHQPLTNLELHLVHRGSQLMPQHNSWVRDRFRHLLTQRGIHVHLGEDVQTVQSHSVKSHLLQCRYGLNLPCDHIIWVTQASAPPWLDKSGLAVNPAGFVLVDDTLRSLSHPDVFAAGDIATMVHHPRPKAGVFAVRQGKPLFQNLRRALLGQPLQPFRPQKRYLSLIGTGYGEAIASWGPFGCQSSLLWWLKERIDRQFMKQFSDF